MSLALWTQLLAQGRTVTLRARGVSMRPFLRDGDVLTIAPLPARRNDVVAALRDGELVVHRVLRVDGDRALLQGDALRTADGWVTPLGRVVRARRGDRTLRAWRLPLPRVVKLATNVVSRSLGHR